MTRQAELRGMVAEATPGPWRAGKSYRAIVSDSPSGYDDAQSVEAYGGHMVCESVQDHNARLLAQAPTLATDLAAALDREAALREAVVAADAMAEAAWHHDEAFCIIEDSAQESARRKLEVALESYRDARAALESKP